MSATTGAEAPPLSPWIPASEAPAELTFRAVALGAVLGIVFGAASVYLGLRVGLTTSASIPIAVMAITILKKLGHSTILENNIVQTTGSAGESVAAAVVFTIPALIFLGFPMKIPVTFLVALTGGVLGVLMMIPLRRYLIVKESAALRFPEGTACAEILIAGEKGGTSARKIFTGIGLGAAFKLSTAVFGLFQARVARALAFYPGARLECETSPELLAVGWIIGYESSALMVGGGVLAALILSPMIVFFGSGSAAASSWSTGRTWTSTPCGPSTSATSAPASSRPAACSASCARRPRSGIPSPRRSASSGARSEAAASCGRSAIRRSRGSSEVRSGSSRSSRSSRSSG